MEIKDLESEAARSYAGFMEEMRGWRVVLSSLAATVLLVGGVGVLSVMLISFSDRKYEIGLRKSLGASDGEILVQFLLEACVLAALGASAGTIGGAVALPRPVADVPVGPRREPDGPRDRVGRRDRPRARLRPLPRDPRLAPLADGGDAVGPKIARMAARRRTNVHPLNARSLRAAAARLRRGELVAFPTETVYGLGANALDAKAVAKIFAAKGRPHDNPVIVHVSDMKMLRRVVRRRAAARANADRALLARPPDPHTF